MWTMHSNTNKSQSVIHVVVWLCEETNANNTNTVPAASATQTYWHLEHTTQSAEAYSQSQNNRQLYFVYCIFCSYKLLFHPKKKPNPQVSTMDQNNEELQGRKLAIDKKCMSLLQQYRNPAERVSLYRWTKWIGRGHSAILHSNAPISI